MKKLLILLFCVTLLICAFVSCGKGDGGDPTNSTSPSNNMDSSNPQGGGSSDNSQNGNDQGGNDQGGNDQGGNDLTVDGELKYQYDLDEYISLPEYKDYELTVKLDTVQQKIDTYIMKKAVKSKRSICMVGDVVNVSYFGYHIDENGEILFENGSPVTFNESESYGVYLGSRLALEEFEKGIVGMKIGDIKEIYVTFPQDYYQKDLAGKKVIFEIILNSIYEAPLYNDAFVKNNFPEYAGVKEYENSMKQEAVLDSFYSYVIENAVVKSYPTKEYSEFADELNKMEDGFQDKYKISLDEYLQNEFQMTRDEYIKNEMKKEMVVLALAKSENVTPTQEQIELEKERLVAYYTRYYIDAGATQSEAKLLTQDVVKDLGKHYIYENAVRDILDKKVVEYVTVNEVGATYKSVTDILYERQSIERGSEIGMLCPSFDADVFDENGTLDTTLDPSRNIGKYTVINLWGTWCGPCKLELPDFDRVAKEYEDRVTIYAIHSSNYYGQASEYVQENFLDSKIVFMKDYMIDPNDPYSYDMFYQLLGGNGYYPYTIILDENGIIREKHVGMMTYDQLVEILTNLGLEK